MNTGKAEDGVADWIYLPLDLLIFNYIAIYMSVFHIYKCVH